MKSNYSILQNHNIYYSTPTSENLYDVQGLAFPREHYLHRNSFFNTTTKFIQYVSERYKSGSAMWVGVNKQAVTSE
jgi:hypothetical protein